MSTSAERLKALRSARKITQRELSRISGVSQQAISCIENGRNSPSESTMQLLANALGCTVSELLGEQEQVSTAQELTPDERRLLTSFRAMSRQGQEYVLQTVDMAVKIYTKRTGVSDLEDAQ